MMKPEVAHLWVEALESGEYEQCGGVLSIEENGHKAFCCLGVLCEVAIAQGVKLEKKDSGDNHTTRADADIISYNGSTGHLPVEVADWAGLDTTSPRIAVPAELGGHQGFTSLNDFWLWDFRQIAAQIRKEWLDEATPSGTE